MDKSKTKIMAMFDQIASSYDNANDILSLGQHRKWKELLVKEALRAADNDLILDLCCGTGDIMLALNRNAGKCFGLDFTHNMLKQISKRDGNNQINYLRADALHLPFNSESFKVVTIAYGLRNFENLATGISEIHRVLKPGGHCFVLEFGTQPDTLIGRIIRAYEERILPFLGGLISGNRSAYKYLADSSQKFPAAQELAKHFNRQNLTLKEFRRMTLGASYYYHFYKQI